LIINYAFPSNYLEWFLRYLESSNSIAPPPATILVAFIYLLTIIIESLRDLSASAINCSAPPLRTKVQDIAFGHSVKTLKRSAPICLSSKFPTNPRTSEVIPLHVVWIFPPTAFYVRIRSSFTTLPAQKISLSAKYWVARSPIGSLDKTILAPVSTIF